MSEVITRLIVDLSEKEIAIIDGWIVDYLTYGIEPTRENALHDMILKVADDMRDMNEDL